MSDLGPFEGLKQNDLQAPSGLKEDGQKLWFAAANEYEFAQHELAVLEEACRTRDRIVELDALVVEQGLMLASSQGSRLHPGIAEVRQQRLTLARLLVSLGIPALADDDLPASSGVRGFYRKRA
ncbi:terminase [Arthrobacter agilis]|uniref:terminase n=1 Tax=Arthrobacter agilis TaxID=37921 RepID=UPI001ABF9611|nr:terminase [Arthrobacter agilis]